MDERQNSAFNQQLRPSNLNVEHPKKRMMWYRWKANHPFYVDNKQVENETSTQNLASYNTKRTEFKCFVCGESFELESALKCHGKTHTDQKPFQYNICLQSSSHNSNLNKHKRTHTGEKPFQCDVCGKNPKKTFN